MGKLSLKLFNPNSRNETSKQRCLIHRLRYASGYTQHDAGFSLLELIVVMVMIGILSAIAAPGWLAFVNRQKVNKVNDAVLAALQEAQREAKNKKLSYSVSFQKNSTTQNAEVAVYNTNAGSPTWKPLGADVGISSDKFLLGANLTSQNTAGSSVSYTLSASTKITFDYMGTLPNASFGTPVAPSTEPPGLKIVVAVPSSANSTSASSVKRCVIVKTLLGSMLTAQDDKCS
ncbi:prepilin-type N-terminal cleavage/methylation domain-containing protein [Nostoc sp. C057]|uniref:pilus assembly FimT family protein n=1 Tax=Nostoc sp. C057 TaxID=2576903 RepID=UPI0015C34CF8|nr:prepilin-type N-terminal cleavage/methylation domain-containing protein [Nostoc sp. C057]QLE46761.1 prepilin-type N-terminal cleavage/methylation domain-containing protein [Nostoc sp. C057]